MKLRPFLIFLVLFGVIGLAMNLSDLTRDPFKEKYDPDRFWQYCCGEKTKKLWVISGNEKSSMGPISDTRWELILDEIGTEYRADLRKSHRYNATFLENPPGICEARYVATVSAEQIATLRKSLAANSSYHFPCFMTDAHESLRVSQYYRPESLGIGEVLKRAAPREFYFESACLDSKGFYVPENNDFILLARSVQQNGTFVGKKKLSSDCEERLKR